MSGTPLSPRRGDAPPTVRSELDLSLRWAWLLLVVPGAVWLLVGSVLGLIASIKFHSPEFLAAPAWLTYGRVRPAQLTAWLYGFGLPGGLAASLWMLCQLGRVRVVAGGLVAVGALVWHLGVVLGVVGILTGAATGFEWLEIPGFALPVLFVGYALVAVAALLTFFAREQRELHPAHWFVVAAGFWFPWIFSTAALLLVFTPVRGVLQALVNWWYANNLLHVWTGLVGAGLLMYFVPKSLERPLHSRYLALVTFGGLVGFGSWAGVPTGAPLPAWIPAVSRAAGVLGVITWLAFAVNHLQTTAGQAKRSWAQTPLAFAQVGAWAFVLAGVLTTVLVLGDGSLRQTWFLAAQTHVQLYGFLAMTLFGVIYHALPRILDAEFLGERWLRAHFWLATGGTACVVLALMLAGLAEHRALGNVEIAFVDVARKALPFLRLSTVGELALALGHLLLLGNLAGLLARRFQTHCRPRLVAWFRPEAAEVRS